MLSAEAIIAANRFGLGARPEEAAAIESDPKAWLKRQVAAAIAGEAPLPEPLRGLPAATSHSEAVFRARITAGPAKADGAAEAVARARLIPAFRAEAAALFRAQVLSPLPFVERWAMFWANHFTVAYRNPLLGAMAGGFEREAIRPHLFGRFGDMLLAAAQHPAMQLYLDNASSFGPSSPAGARTQVGLTENHAREILELHTVSRDGGYTQGDVVALARILSGWTLGRVAQDGCSPGHFCFAPRRHEPGVQVLLGINFAQQGRAQGEAALAMLAAHPATARHIGFKLARHFIADDPPAEAASALEAAFSRSGGNLRAVAETLIELPEAWRPEPAKLRSPREWLLAMARLSGADWPPDRLLLTLRGFGQAAFGAPSPAGWPDRAEAWLGSDALRQRMELAHATAQRVTPAVEPRTLIGVALGETARQATRVAMQRAESMKDALAVLLAAPDFQWR